MPPRQARAAVKATRPRVYARVKPNIGEDAGAAELFTVTDTTLEYLKEEGAEATKFGFDKVFGTGSTQDEIFEEVGETSLRALRQGFNSTVLAYGQTGAGKSFSMEGPANNKGLVPRIFQRAFELFSGDGDIKSFEISLQFFELYNEQLQDLLNERKPVDVTADPAGGYVCKNGSKVVVTSAQDAEQVYAAGRAKRDTNANQARSHGVVLLTISWVEAKGKRAAGLSLVDLAGSEGLKKGRGSVKEGLKVNLSLTKLALVVKCLAEGTKNVPFRESKLTMILQKSLGGNNMLHVVLALNNNKEQVEMGTASMRFGQACLSMTVKPDQGMVEKEQAGIARVQP